MYGVRCVRVSLLCQGCKGCMWYKVIWGVMVLVMHKKCKMCMKEHICESVHCLNECV